MIKFCVRAIGKLKNKAILSLIDDYKSRITNSLELNELEIKKSTSIAMSVVKNEEAKLLLSDVKRGSYKIALDERGENLSSHQLAELVQSKSIAGYSSFTFFIGGADGLDDSVRSSCDKIISFGRITLPHMLARLVLIEQIYRIEKIISNHPYDK